MMSPERKRAIRDLTRAKIDPVTYARAGFKRPNWWMYVNTNAPHVISIAAPILIFNLVSAFLGFYFLLAAIPVFAIAVIVVFAFSPKSNHQRLQELGKDHNYQLCVWCTHPIEGLPDRAPCPECGVPYDLKASAVINGSNYNPLQPDPKVVRRRRKYAFARLLRERDRAHPTTQPSSP